MLNLSFVKFIFKIFFSPTFFFLLGFNPLTASVLTDTDGDGMTDVAELKYGFDPNDADSFTQSFYTEDVSEKSQSLDGKMGTDDDIVYYNFRDYTDESTIEKYKDFINKVLPIMYYRLGHPANTMNIRFWKRYPKNSGWMCIPKTSPWILSDGSFKPRLIVHEMFHAWTAKHGMTSRSQNNKIGNYDPIFSGWEEVAEGVCQEILIDFTKAYPTDSANSLIRNHTFSTITSYKFDLQKNLEYLHGGSFWTDGLSSLERYGLSAGVAQHFMIADEQFYKRFFEKYYAEIHQNPDYRVTSERLINLYSSVLPEVNGISTKKFLGDITSLRGTKLPNKFHSVVRQDRRFNSILQVFCGFADSNKGELWWTSSIKTKDELASHGIPSWFPTFHANDGYFYTDTRNEEYVLSIKKLNGELVKEIKGKVSAGTRNDGGPMNVAHDSPSASYASNFDLGLYKANVAFPRFKNFTEDYISEDVYYFGLKGTNFNSKTRKAFIGIDTNASVSEIKLKIGDEVFLPNRVGDNVVEISMSSIPWDFRGVAELIVTSEENVSHTFRRSVTFLTSPDKPKIGIVKWLIVDVNFDGVEDMYGSASDNEEVIVDDTTTPIVDNNDTEVVVDDSKRQIINDERCRETTTKLEHEIKDQKIEITDLNILIIELRKQVADLNSSNLALTTEVTGLKNQVSNLNGQATNLTTENGELKGQVNNLKEDNGNMQVTVTSLNEQLVKSNRIAKTPFVHDWVYTPDYGWLHIDPQNFPIIYKNDTQTWHFYEQGSINPRYFYNFNEQKWEAWDPTE